VTDLATIAITLHIWFTIPIIDNPVNLWFEELCSTDERKSPFLWRAVIRTVFLACQTAIALGLPHFGDVMAFIGASCVSTTVFFLPCFIYLKLYWKSISSLEVAWICLVLLFATLGSSIGLYSAFLKLIQDIMKKTLFIPNWVFYVVLGVSTFVGFILLSLGIVAIWRQNKNNRNYNQI